MNLTFNWTLLVICLSLAASGCSGESTDSELAASHPTEGRAIAPAPLSLEDYAEEDLLLYAGTHERLFLGCLTCNQFHRDSVWNQFGPYGSDFSEVSIWNSFGKFGSELSEFSPWNRFGRSAPIIRGIRGRSYGRFTVNVFHEDRTVDLAIVGVLDDYGYLRVHREEGWTPMQLYRRHPMTDSFGDNSDEDGERDDEEDYLIDEGPANEVEDDDPGEATED